MLEVLILGHVTRVNPTIPSVVFEWTGCDGAGGSTDWSWLTFWPLVGPRLLRLLLWLETALLWGTFGAAETVFQPPADLCLSEIQPLSSGGAFSDMYAQHFIASRESALQRRRPRLSTTLADSVYFFPTSHVQDVVVCLSSPTSHLQLQLLLGFVFGCKWASAWTEASSANFSPLTFWPSHFKGIKLLEKKMWILLIGLSFFSGHFFHGWFSINCFS